MVGIGAVLLVIIFILGAIGIIRGPAKELGVAMAVVVLLAVFLQFDNLVGINELPEKVNSAMAAVGLGTDNTFKRATMAWFLYSAGIVFTAFLAYHGQDTLAFNFRVPSGIFGAILGWLVGAVNGWLVGGGVWYYLDKLGYPIQQYDWFSPQFTETAQRMVGFLPQNLFGDSSGLVLSALALGLLWLRILR
jgi:hypothetical protein